MASKITYLTDKEFYIGVSKKLNISPEKVKEYYLFLQKYFNNFIY